MTLQDFINRLNQERQDKSRALSLRDARQQFRDVERFIEDSFPTFWDCFKDSLGEPRLINVPELRLVGFACATLSGSPFSIGALFETNRRVLVILEADSNPACVEVTHGSDPEEVLALVLDKRLNSAE